MPRPNFAQHKEDMVALYLSGMSQKEIAAKYGLGQSGVYRILVTSERYVPRSRATRNQWGAKHPRWIGSKVSYKAAHQRVDRARGKPQHCTACGRTAPGPKGQYEWCNLTGNFHDVNDYVRMCRQCHRKFDARRRRENMQGKERSNASNH